MKYQKGTRRRALEYEKDLVNFWKQESTFEKSVNQRPAESAFVFYDGPPFITGVPHHGTLLSSIVKDVVPRYQTMKGHRVERVWGWDCHGLPAEVYTEKKLGIKGKPEVLAYGLEKYIMACRENMVATGDLWEETIDRIGRWVDFKGAYKTMDKNYMESVWWAFKTLYEKGKIYEGEKVLMYCTQDATPLSKAEVTMDSGSYQDVTDPSVYVKFKLNSAPFTKEKGAVYLLAWTTTPWTLPANTAVAVNKDIQYEVVRYNQELYVLAKELVDSVFTDEKHQPLEIEKIAHIKGTELTGLGYEPLFENRGENAHKVWDADYVTTESGTGIVHLAPAYGEEDFELAQAKGFPVVSNIDENGHYDSGEWKGENVWESNKRIAKELLARGVVFKIDYYKHSYPHCYRCGTRLMYRAHPSWFFNINDQRTEMLEQNGNVNWFPGHLKHGRFEKTILAAPDWNLSRDRFWATAMPVWKATDDKGVEHIKVIGSYAELKELSGVELEDYHRPWIDDVTFEIDGLTYKRIDKVLDCWFESGSMPFAQFHYPFENVEKFEANFPGDFIVEYVGQVRAWFYYVHAVSVGLFGKNAFNNVITTGTLLGSDGRKLSKSLNNFTDPNELMDKFSADSLRFLLVGSPVLAGEDFIVNDKDVGDVARKLSMIWNMYDFFTLYAEVDKWEYDGKEEDPSATVTNTLDIWILSRMHQLISEVENHMERYDLPNAVKPILPFIDDASNWYVRRSRKRFWKSDNDSDKNEAYRTLHFVLVQLSKVLAPFTPLLAEELYQKLTGGESVHLLDWPTSGHVNEMSINDMTVVRTAISEGLNQRAQAGIKVRQPLAAVSIPGTVSEELAQIVAEELNVKEVTQGGDVVEIDTTLTKELLQEGLARDVIRQVQEARKNAGLDVDDRILLRLETTNDELKEAIAYYEATIWAETLTKSTLTSAASFMTEAKLGDATLTILLTKVA